MYENIFRQGPTIVEPRYNETLYNEVLYPTNSKIYERKSRYNETS